MDALLRADDFEERLGEWHVLPARQVINPLIGSLCSPDETLKWRAVRAIGAVVSHLADRDMESARTIMRRFIWNLNDESGGIGWGSPEAMGEIMAVHERLADEYHRILISYIDEGGNHLGNALLERGVLWGLGRLAQVRPSFVRDAIPHIASYLASSDPIHRGLAAWVLAILTPVPAPAQLEVLLSDMTEVRIFDGGNIKSFLICDLVARAVKNSGKGDGLRGSAA